MESYIKSPKTNRWITVDGKAYQDLLKDKKYAAKAKSAKRVRKPATGSKTLHKGKVTKRVTLPKAPIAPLRETIKHEPATRKAKIRDLEAQATREMEGRGIKTRGWKAVAPQKGRERHELMKVCGEECFLMPGREGFPICPSVEEGPNYRCKVDCRGVNAAYIRAKQWGYPKVARSAEALKKKYKC